MAIRLFLKTIFPLLILFAQSLSAQKVGVVLSGGGASGLAHIGVLKALEENNIPIDYITGTSMGALVGALYASGMAPVEIEGLVKSSLFQQIAYGLIDDKYIYYFKQKEPNSSWITLRFSPNSIFESTLPTNLISPFPADLTLLEQFSGIAAMANYDFDNLFVPFRCVAADIVSKKQVVFRKGNLNEAVRASISYPFYLKPMKIDGKLLFDGGLYNNFPSDIMLEDFFPDIIIGSSVSGNMAAPEEDNLISQIKSILVTNSNFSTLCDNGIMIEPKTDVSLFDFDNPGVIIQQGYAEALLRIEEVKAAISRRVDNAELTKRRVEYREKVPPLNFSNVHINGLNKKQAHYVRKILLQKDRNISFNDLKKNYYRLISDDKINYIYPVTQYNKSTNTYDLFLTVKKEREFTAHFGGNISNKPINQGFVGLQYNYFGAQAVSVFANTYFGKLYGSGQIKTRIDFSTRLPFYIEGGHTLNRWDFFRSSNAFFEDVRPTYLIQNESYSDLFACIPVSNKGKLKTGSSYSHLRNEYYQTKTFTLADTADNTIFRVMSYFLSFERNSLNRKQYASEGNHIHVTGRIIHGEEFTRPGSTAISETPFRGIHDWLQVKATYDKYVNKNGRFKFGFYLEGNFSNQPFFHNYTSTILAAPGFTPTPETKTIFLEKFRAHNYGAFGLKQIINIRKNIDLRIIGYVFQPMNDIVRTPDQKAAYGKILSTRNYIATTNLVYHSPLGPLSISMNYYEKEEIPWSFLFHFGYILFNDRALD